MFRMNGYVQDKVRPGTGREGALGYERYTAGAGMRWSGAFQFCTVFGAGMPRSGLFQIGTVLRML